MLALWKPRSRKTRSAASRMRPSTSPARSLGGLPGRAACLFALLAIDRSFCWAALFESVSRAAQTVLDTLLAAWQLKYTTRYSLFQGTSHETPILLAHWGRPKGGPRLWGRAYGGSAE